jgi:hypothetical protein
MEQLFYSVLPKVVRADRVQEVTIKPLFKHVFFKEDAEYEISVVPQEHIMPQGKATPCLFDLGEVAAVYGKTTVIPQGGALRFSWLFSGEQEHLIYVREVGVDTELRGPFHVYSLNDDLFTRFPFKGDLHMHSCRSDGKEAPAYVAACSRRIGLDFMALTDHGQYQPSLEAQGAFDRNKIGLKIFPGEEVHAPENPVHIINFGGKFSVNELFRGAGEVQYRREVEELERKLPAAAQGVNSYEYASCLWVFNKIRESGGLGIFCHPYWQIPSGYSPSGRLTDYFFETQPFDAFEVIGGYYRHQAESNALQVARYHEERAKGKRIPIVGVTDAHGCEGGELFGWYYTIVFSPSTQLADLTESIKNLYSVAVEAMPGEFPRIHGPLRLVKFAYFALRELFAQHDELSREEGLLMLEHLKGDASAQDRIAKLKGKTRLSVTGFWAKS